MILCCVLFLNVCTISAEPLETYDYYSLEEVVDDESQVLVPLDDLLSLYAADGADDQQPVVALADAARPFYGSVWVTGNASNIGSGTLYLPLAYQSGFLGLTDNGYLVNVGNTSLTAYFYADSGNQYTVTMSFGSIPRYRLSSSNYSYEDFYFTPVDSNAVIADSDGSLADFEYLIPSITLVLLGGVFVCLLTRSRH